MNEVEIKTFDTPDLALAGFLHCNGIRLNRIDLVEMKDRNGRKYNQRYAFIFDEFDKCKKLEINYANDGEVPIRKYDDSVRLLKMMIKHRQYNMTEEEKKILGVKN